MARCNGNPVVLMLLLMVCFGHAAAQQPDLVFAEGRSFDGGSPLSNALTINDFDLDGELDVVFANHNEGANEVAPFEYSDLFLNVDGRFPDGPAWYSLPSQFSHTAAASGDIDGDGDIDLVLGTLAGTGCLVYFGEGGMLGTGFPPETNNYFKNEDIALGDLDGDGYLDLACADDNAPDLVIAGGPDGLTDVVLWTSPYTEASTGVAWGDVDGNGDLDLVVSSKDGPTRLFLGDGTNLATVPVWTSPDTVTTWDVALGDLTGNGRLDIVCANGDSGQGVRNTVYRNDGGGAFTLFWSSDPATVGETQAVDLGDVDGDGDLDIFFGDYGVGSDTGSRSWIYRNEGLGQLGTAAAWWDIPTTSRLTDVALVDLDGDGMLDQVISRYGADNVYRLNALGSLADVPRAAGFRSGYGVVAVAAGNMDGDGAPDLVVGYADAPMEIYRNRGGVFGPVPDWQSADPYDLRALCLADVDGDGDEDVVGGGWGPDVVFLNDGGSFTARTFGPGDSDWLTDDVALADVDGDGLPELACGHIGKESTDLPAPVVLYGNTGVGFADTVWSSDEALVVRGLGFADLDRDGDQDLVCGVQDDGFRVYANLGGTLTRQASWSTHVGGDLRDLVLGDVNGDGYPDLVAAYKDEFNTLHLNHGGTLSAAPDWSSLYPWSTSAVALGDADGDGDLDLYCANSAEANQYLTLYEWRDGGFVRDPPTWLSRDSRQTAGLALADLDRDGDLDLVCPADQDSVGVYLGLAAAPLPGPVPRPLPEQPARLRDVTIRPAGADNLYTVAFTLVDPEEDRVNLVAEYQILGEPVWLPAEVSHAGGALPLFRATAAGSRDSLLWDVFRVPVHDQPLVLRLRATTLPDRTGLIRAAPGYLGEPVQVMVVRQQIAFVQTDLAFATVTYGDTASVPLNIENVGLLPLHVSDLAAPAGAQMRFEPAGAFTVPPGDRQTVTVLLEPTDSILGNGVVTVTSDDPLSGVRTIPVSTDIRPLAFVARLLTEADPPPVGVPITAILTPAPQVVLEDGHLFYRPTGAAHGFVDSLRLVPEGDDFIAVIPDTAVSEEGFDYYLRVENSGVYAREPGDAPGDYLQQAVARPVHLVVAATGAGPSGHPAGSAVRFEADLTTGTHFVAGELHYRRGGDADFVTVPFAEGETGPFAFVPESAVTAAGLEYWSRIQTLTVELQYPADQPAVAPALLAVTTSLLVAPEAVDAERYHLVSVPLDFGAEFDGTLEDILFDQAGFGSYDPVRWRCFRWDPQDESYRELTRGAEDFRLVPGRAFWLVSRGAEAVDTAPAVGRSVDTSGPFSVTLAPGWNQVGHPFTFPVAWADLTVDALAAPDAVTAVIVEEPVRMDWRSGQYARDVTSFESFSGYWVRNLTDSDIVLGIPPVGSSTAKAVPAPNSQDGWTVVVTAAWETHVDRVRLGVRDGAEEGRDRWDLSTPPPGPGSALSLYVIRDDWGRRGGRMAADLRPLTADDAGQAGLTWPLDLAKIRSNDGLGDLVRLSVDGLDGVPAAWSVMLIDRLTGTSHDLREHTHVEVAIGRQDGADTMERARFLLITGTREYLAAGQSLPLVPSATRLVGNRPNPFNPVTLVRFQLHAEARVRLDIHDLRGRRVRTLSDGPWTAGRHEVPWDGRDGRGRDVATGVYFCRMTTDAGYQATHKLMLVR